jgi:hypothetical protein
MTDKLLKSLPETTFDFEIEVKGDSTGKLHKGAFTYRKPNLKMKALAERKRAELEGPFAKNLDLSVQKLNFMISYLRFSLEKAPDWWTDSDNGYELFDFNVVEEVFNKCDKFESDWDAKVFPKAEPEEDGKSKE